MKHRKTFVDSHSVPHWTGLDEYVRSGLKNNSVFNPKKGTHHFMEAFKIMIQDEVKNLKIKRHKNNTRIWEGMKKLEKMSYTNKKL